MLLIPELEKASLDTALSDDAKDRIQSFVEDGGNLVISASYGNNDENLINDIFGFSITSGSIEWSNVPTFDKTAAASGTPFDAGPSQLNNPDGTYSWDINSLPAGAEVIYSDGDNAAVVVIPVGSGQITFLAYDWYNAAPVGAQDGGWSDVLDIAVTNGSGEPANIAVFDNGAYVDSDNGFWAESDNIQATLAAQGHNVTTFTGTTDEDFDNALNLVGTGSGVSGDLAGEETVATGSLDISWGADDANDDGSVIDRSVAFAAQSAPAGLSADGEPVSYLVSDDGLTLTAYTGTLGEVDYTEVFNVTLSDEASGSYTFTLLGNLDHPEADTEDDLALSFDFIATDADGDSAEGSFTVTVDDDAPVIGTPEADSVDEEGLDEGNAGDSYSDSGDLVGEETVATGSLDISWGADDANDDGSVIDRSVAFAAQSAPAGLTADGEPVSYLVSDDGLTLTAYTGTVDEDDYTEVFNVTLSDEASGSYTFTLLGNLDHPEADTEDDLALSFDFIATDADGDSAEGSFTVTVDDDAPVIGTPEADSVDEEGIDGNAGDSYSDSGDLAGEETVATGSLDINWGADDANDDGSVIDRSVAFAAQSAPAGLTADGEPVSYLVSDDGLTLTAYTGTLGEVDYSEVFNVTLSDEASGSYTFTLLGNLDHPEADTEDDLALSFDFIATDADGDSAEGSFTVTVDDDAPVIGTPEADSVDEEGLEEGNAGDSYSDSGDLAGEETVATGSLDISWGADDANDDGSVIDRSVAFAAQSAPAGLSADGEPVSYLVSDDGLTLTAYTGTVDEDDYTEVFNVTLSDEASGSYTFTLLGNLDHPEADTEDDLALSFDFIATDADGDSAEGSFTVTVDDDAPVIGTPEADSVDEEGLDEGNAGDSYSDSGDLAGEETVATGSLDISWGADDANDDGSVIDRSVAFAAQSAPAGLTADGEPVSYLVSDDGLTLTAYTGTLGEVDYTEVFNVTLSDEASGSYTFTLLGNLDHPEADTEDDLALSFDFIATDADGDSAEGSFTVTVDDDAPVATEESISVTVDEDDIRTDLSTGNAPNDGNGDGSFTGDASNPFDHGPAVVSGSVAALVSFGADGGTFSLSNDFSALLDQGLTSQGDELTYSLSPSGDMLVAEADGREVFTLTLAADGSYSFELYDQLDHATGEGENNLPIDLSALIVATDGDGDSITLESGFVVNVTDDVPEEAGLLPEGGVVEEEALPDGNQELNDGSIFGFPVDGWPDTAVATGSLAGQVSVGADETLTFSLGDEVSALTSQGLSSGDVDLTYSVDGDTLTALAGGSEVFTLVLQANGSYVFTLKAPLDHPEGIVEENPLRIDLSSVVNATDSDGDRITLDNDFFISVIDDSPEVDDNATIVADEDDLASGVGDEQQGDQDPQNLTGVLSHAFGADGAGSIDFAAMDGTAALYGNGQPITSGGEAISYSWDATGSTLTAATSSGTEVFTLVVDPTTGAYSFTLLSNIDHREGRGNSDDTENPNVHFDLTYTVTDADGDTADGSIRVMIDDDIPVIEEQTVAVVDDEGLADGIPGGVGDDVTQGSDESTYSGTLNFTPGADQPARVDFAAMDGTSGTLGTENVVYTWAGNTLTATVDGGDRDGTALFTLEVTDAETGAYQITLLDNVLHESLDGMAGDDTENNAQVSLSFTVTDSDGDSQNGTLVVDFDDDTPTLSSQSIEFFHESFEDFSNIEGNGFTVVYGSNGQITGNDGIVWTVNDAGIEIQAGSTGGASASDGDVHAELDTDNNGTLLTQLSTSVELPGEAITLSFDYQPRPGHEDDSDMVVTFGGYTIGVNSDAAGNITLDPLPTGVSATLTGTEGGWTTISLSFSGLDTASPDVSSGPRLEGPIAQFCPI